MVVTSLPWLTVQLGDVVSYGKTEKCELSDVTGDTWILELEDIEKDSSKIIQRLDASARPFKSTKNKFSKGDVLYGKLRPYLNKVVIADNSGVCSTEIIPLNAEPYIDNRYLFYWLKSEMFLEFVNSVSYGVNMPRLGTKDGVTAPFVLAPLAEQKVIADKLDTLLAQVEATKARLERIPKILKNFRQSVLVAAVSGRLTEKWREETECVDNVLHNIQKEKKSWIKNNPDHNEVKRVLKRVKEYSNQTKLNEVKLPEMWSWSQLEDCVLMIVDCHNKTAPYSNVGLPLIRTSNIRDGKFIWDNLKFVSDDTYKYWSRRCPPEPGDIIFTREAPMGEAAIIPPKHKLCLGQRTMLIRPVERYMSAKFLLISLMDPNFRKRSEELAVGTGVKHYRIGDVSNLVIAVPPTEEQTEVVRHVEQLFDFADSIEQKANAALDRVNKISQSILAKAFRGDLTADWRAANPDLISGKNSAEALLEKIKAEREVIKRQPKPKRPAVDKKKGNCMSKPIKVVEALKQAGEPLSGQQLLAAAGYPNDSSTEQLEQFFLDIRDALTIEESIVKLERGGDSQDWFALANNKAKN
ncbi:TPA: restriction endonuclease subunit S [Raoultella planticola]|uniref:restriction endonuclease subunit S n=1 Tax=Raoultella planticola TaxID=575 RepID=UPI00069D22A2|nr:restriction endonuclease subunit S [Raoultella planticola]EIY2678364.1 restriction endonuclease subunit S [Raoultella planticola]EKW5591601.1 restriction endonuclease subunit S [Raoultella planticola]ELU1428738.1 restriction endonuclease subunit S [Raoultella planticola]MCQ6500547.1 restriction endonuclease subunit S [Raoultella planticola]TQN57907.1 restriction endonuclease subunit S [Raoultella planticola]